MATLVPKPESLRALLIPSGRAPDKSRPFRQQATPHRYVKTEPCLVKLAGEKTASAPAWEHIYECEVTGRRRRWGVENRRDGAIEDAEPIA